MPKKQKQKAKSRVAGTPTPKSKRAKRKSQKQKAKLPKLRAIPTLFFLRAKRGENFLYDSNTRAFCAEGAERNFFKNSKKIGDQLAY